MKRTKTKRGFTIIKFKDDAGIDCSIQESSTTGIWIGAYELGLNVGYPWRKISDDEIRSKFNASEFVANNRIRLTEKQLKKLIPVLQKFIEKGEL